MGYTVVQLQLKSFSLRTPLLPEDRFLRLDLYLDGSESASNSRREGAVWKDLVEKFCWNKYLVFTCAVCAGNLGAVVISSFKNKGA